MTSIPYRIETHRTKCSLTARDIGPLSSERVSKRFLDLILSLLLIPLLAPLWAILVILIKLDSRGAVIYRQTRVGKGDRRFTLYKLRTMTDDAERETGPVWATEPDRRATRVGRLLRRYGIDETLQVVNVLKGEMSLVGPRPERPFFVAQFCREMPSYAERLRVKPGITGWAQVNMPHHYGLSFDNVCQKAAYDLYYVSHPSFWLDLKILLKTGLMFTGRSRTAEAGIRSRKPSMVSSHGHDHQ